MGQSQQFNSGWRCQKSQANWYHSGEKRNSSGHIIGNYLNPTEKTRVIIFASTLSLQLKGIQEMVALYF